MDCGVTAVVEENVSDRLALEDRLNLSLYLQVFRREMLGLGNISGGTKRSALYSHYQRRLVQRHRESNKKKEEDENDEVEKEEKEEKDMDVNEEEAQHKKRRYHHDKNEDKDQASSSLSFAAAPSASSSAAAFNNGGSLGFSGLGLGLGTPQWDLIQCVGDINLIRRMNLEGVLKGHTGCVNSCSFNESGDLLVSGGDDLKVIVWDYHNQEKKVSADSGHDSNIFQTLFLPTMNNRVIITSARDGMVRRIVIREAGIDTYKLFTHRESAHRISLCPGSPHTFLSCSEDGGICHFDLRQPKPANFLGTLQRSNRSVPTSLNTINFHPFNPFHFAVGEDESFVRLFDLRKGISSSPPICTFQPFKKNIYSVVTSIAWSHNGDQFVASFNDDDIYLFDYYSAMKNPQTSPEVEIQSYTGHRNNKTVKGVNFFGPRSEYVISGSDCGNIFFWKTSTGEAVNMFKGDNYVVNCLVPHPTTCALATSGIECHVKIWKPTAKKCHKLTMQQKAIMETNITNKRKNRGLYAHANPLLNLLQMENRDFATAFLQVLGAFASDDDENEEDTSGNDNDDDDGDESHEDSGSYGNEEEGADDSDDEEEGDTDYPDREMLNRILFGGFEPSTMNDEDDSSDSSS